MCAVRVCIFGPRAQDSRCHRISLQKLHMHAWSSCFMREPVSSSALQLTCQPRSSNTCPAWIARNSMIRTGSVVSLQFTS